MGKTTLLSLLAAALFACAAPAPQDPAAVTELLRLSTSSAIDRASWEALPGALELAGDADFLGTKAPFTLTLFADGRYRQEVGGALGKVEVFDGTHVYKRDFSGVMRKLSLASHNTALVFPSLISGSWLSDASPFHLATAGGAYRLAMRTGPTNLQVEVDPKSGLPTRYTERGSAGLSRTTFEDWRVAAGILTPHRIRVEDEQDGPETELRVASVRRVSGEGLLDVQLGQPGDVSFDPAIPTKVEVMRVDSGHILVHPKVNGEDVGWFILDSGAGAMVIDPEVAEQLGMELVGEVLATGVAGTTRSGFRAGREFSLGPMTWDGQVYVEVELAFLERAFGVPVAGIVGYGFFSRAVVEVEPSAEFVAVHDPNTFKLEGDHWSPLLFDGHTASVMATFDAGDGPLTEPFRMDTGADGTVTFHTPAVERLGLLSGRDLTRTTMGGVGGSGTAFEGTIPWFELGGHRFEKPMVAFSQFDIGVFTDEYSTGNLGQEFLEAFRLVFDYSQDRIAFLDRE